MWLLRLGVHVVSRSPHIIAFFHGVLTSHLRVGQVSMLLYLSACPGLQLQRSFWICFTPFSVWLEIWGLPLCPSNVPKFVLTWVFSSLLLLPIPQATSSFVNPSLPFSAPWCLSPVSPTVPTGTWCLNMGKLLPTNRKHKHRAEKCPCVPSLDVYIPKTASSRVRIHWNIAWCPHGQCWTWYPGGFFSLIRSNDGGDSWLGLWHLECRVCQKHYECSVTLAMLTMPSHSLEPCLTWDSRLVTQVLNSTLWVLSSEDSPPNSVPTLALKWRLLIDYWPSSFTEHFTEHC